MKKLDFNLSLYIPVYERSFIKIVKYWVKKVYPDISFSQFIFICVKDRINNLSKKDKDEFDYYALKITERDSPKAVKFVDKYMKTGKL